MSNMNSNLLESRKRSAGTDETDDATDVVLHSPARKRFCSHDQTLALNKRVIGQPVVFPDGIGTNYSYFSEFRHGSPLSEGSSSSLSTVPSFMSLQIDDGRKHADLPFSKVENILPPRHQRFLDRLLVTENIQLDGNRVILYNILPKITAKQIDELIRESGFTTHVVVTVSQDCSASLEFLHPNVASAAYSILQHRAPILWDRNRANLENIPFDKENNSTRLEAGKIPEVIDLTAAADILTTLEDVPILNTLEDVPNLNTFENDPYRNLSKDVYEDDDDDDDSSDTSISPSPHGRRSPGMESMSLTTGHIQDRIGTHLSKIFELPDPGTKTNNNGTSKTRPKARQRKASASCITLPTPRDTSRNDESETYVVMLPKSPHNKPRRVLLSKDSADLPIITVSMRADVQFFDRNKRHRISRFSRPNDSVYRHAIDATIIGATGIIGYGNGPCQVSLVRLSEGHSPSIVELEHNHPHRVSLSPGSRTGKGAISCLAAKGTTNNITQFFTGGYDKTLRLWSVGDANLATTEKLTTLTTIPEALGFRDRSLIVGTSRKILTVDLGHLSSTPTSAQLSNAVCQIHIHNQAPNITILEVNSLDFQVQIFDDRKKHSFNRVADCYFGARETRSLPRSTRGDTNFSMFVKGYGDGTVRMWDYRNSKKPLLTKKYQDIGSVVHTVFAGPNIICYGENSLTFIDISGGTI